MLRKLVLALFGEVGELAEVLQCSGDISPAELASDPQTSGAFAVCSRFGTLQVRCRAKAFAFPK